MFTHDSGSGFTLEPLETRHAPELFGIVSEHRAALGQWLDWPSTLGSLDQTRAWIGALRDEVAADRAVHAVIRHEGAPCGTIALEAIDARTLSASLSCWMSPPFQARGGDVLASVSMLGLGFDELTLERITLKAAAGDPAPRGLARALNLRYEGTSRSVNLVANRFIDMTTYAGLRGEWAADYARATRWPVRHAVPEDAAWFASLRVGKGRPPGSGSGRVDRSGGRLVVERRGVLDLAAGAAGVMNVKRLAVELSAESGAIAKRLLEVAAMESRDAGARLLAIDVPPGLRGVLIEEGFASAAGPRWVKGLI